MLGAEWDQYCYCLFIATKIVLVFPPAFKGSVMIFVMYTNISAISLYFRFRHIYQEENHPFPSSVQVHMMSYTTTPQKSPKRRYLSRSMPTGIKSMLSFWNDYSDFHSKQIYNPVIFFFYMGGMKSILKNTKKNDEIKS